MPYRRALTITVLPRTGEVWPVEARLVAPEALAVLVRGALRLDLAHLADHTTPRAQGEWLGRALFHGPIYDLFLRALGVVGGVLHLALALEAPELRGLPWEYLCGPSGDGFDFLGTDQRVAYSQQIASSVARPFAPLSRAGLRALVIVASPGNLADYDLAPVDAQAAVAAIHAGLGPVPVDVLGDLPDAIGPSTLDRLCAALTARSYAVLHIVAHGRFLHQRGESIVFLAGEDGRADAVAQPRLVARLHDLGDSLPPLCFLTACDSAVEGAAADAPAATGSLARAFAAQLGVAAVVAMNRRVSVTTAHRLATAFYQRLLAHGHLDEALVEATAGLGDRRDVLVPVLYSRLVAQPLLLPPGDPGRTSPSGHVLRYMLPVALAAAVVTLIWAISWREPAAPPHAPSDSPPQVASQPVPNASPQPGPEPVAKASPQPAAPPVPQAIPGPTPIPAHSPLPTSYEEAVAARARTDCTQAGGCLVSWDGARITAFVNGAGYRRCIVFSDDTLRCWGNGGDGALGLNSLSGASWPWDASLASLPLVDAGGQVREVAVGDNHTCALMALRGRVRCWGSDSYGDLGYGPTQNLGDEPGEVPTPDVTVGATAEHIVAGGKHTCVLITDGTVRCWGYNGYGQLGTGDLEHVGDAVDEMPPVAVRDLAGVDQLVAGEHHNCALLKDGAVRCWGYNGHGQLGDGTTTHTAESLGGGQTAPLAPPVDLGGPAQQITAGGHHTCALLRSGTVRCWGRNLNLALGYEDPQSLGDEPGEMPPPDVQLDGRVVQIAAGWLHTCALLDTKKVRCWGDWQRSQLGHGLAQVRRGRMPPQDVPVGDVARLLSSGGEYTCVELVDKSVRCWGRM